MIESILSLICWVWLPALLVLLHHSVWRQQSRLYEWTESPPEAGRWHRSHCDVTPETRRREGALWDLPFILPSLPLPPLCPPPVLLSCDGLILQPGDSPPSTPPPHTPLSLSHPSPTRDAPLLSSPALSCPAQPCLFQPRRLWPRSQKSQFHAHALAHRRRRLLI